MNAAKKIILLLWLVLVASLGNASALTPGASENRVWEKSLATLETRQGEPQQTAGRHQENGVAGYDYAVDCLLAAEGTAAAGDHIVLGLEAHGLEQTATQVGGRTLMTDANWQTTLQTSLGNPSTRFTVSLDGVSGASPYSQFMSAAQKGMTPSASPFNWEMGQIYQAGRQGSVNFMQGGQVVPNPFH